ncbi:hypothetical protein [Microcoleus sp. herbarium13]|uniref:hypothetical protein n=1 Tax=Microcoleus sp. herbarium13 TaxID=3055438 RepID=UPI002FD033E9
MYLAYHQKCSIDCQLIHNSALKILTSKKAGKIQQLRIKVNELNFTAQLKTSNIVVFFISA